MVAVGNARIALAEKLIQEAVQGIRAGSIETAKFAAQSMILDSVLAGINTGRTGVQRQLKVFASALQGEVKRPDRRRVVHKKAGLRAVKAMSEAYESSLQRHEVFARRENRYAGGILGRALKSESMVAASYDGVAFINERFLDSQAAQWYRLNYGAGDEGALTPKAGVHTIRLFERAAGTISLGNRGPSQKFWLPAGRFGFDDSPFTGFPSATVRGEDFTPSSDPKFQPPNAIRFYQPRPTRGIKGRMFMDAGMRELALALGDGYTVLMNEWFAEAVRKGTGPIAGLAEEPNLSDEARALSERSNVNEKILADFNSRWSRLAL